MRNTFVIFQYYQPDDNVLSYFAQWKWCKMNEVIAPRPHDTIHSLKQDIKD